MRRRESDLRTAVIGALILLACAAASAQDAFPHVHLGGLLDARAIDTDTAQSWLDEGLGKTRYGGVEGERAKLFRLSGAALLLDAATSEILSASVQIGVDAQPDDRSGRRPVDLVTAIVSFRPELSPHVRLRLRGGIMYPPVSLEHDGPAWTASRTITPSAANAWIGEEVRTTGVEATLAWKGDHDELAAFGSGFGSNDAAGTLLAWRGWSLHDRVSGFGDQLPLAPLPAIAPAGQAPQAAYSQPFSEIDGRLGYYAGAQWRHAGRLEVNGIYYDNRGNENGFDGYQWAWKTHFTNVGARLVLPFRAEVLGQHMRGRTSELNFGARVVDAPFRTTYGMLSVPFGRSRVSARYDTFAVDADGVMTEDSTFERGHAWTAAYLLRVGEAHRLAFELLRVASDRPDRAVLGLPSRARELQAQLSFQFHF